MRDQADVAVIGAGFGGLATALALAEAGARVVLLERLTYPGGCASTFTREGHRFESGATLFSGLDRDGLVGSWIERHQLPVTVDRIDPPIEFRTPRNTIRAFRDRTRFLEEWLRIPDLPQDRLRRFFRFQRRVADPLWSILGDPDRLPPWTSRSFLRAVRSAASLWPLAPWVGRPLSALLRHHGLDEVRPLRDYLDSLTQITVQCGVEEAEVPFALGAIDYVHRGTGHVRGGIGTLARALAERIEALGGSVEFGCGVRAIRPRGDQWSVETRRGTVVARRVVANLLPRAADTILGEPIRELDRCRTDLDDGWGACMLYRSIGADPEYDVPHHLQLRHRSQGPAIEGHHVFCSVSGPEDGPRTPDRDGRTVTISTHVPLARWRRLSDEERGEYVGEVQERMRRTVDSLVPEWRGRVRREWTASPRTFCRFTGRPDGCVGGLPRRAGISQYLSLGAPEVRPGLWLVGDSVFPGQSTLATAIGGVRAAARVLRSLDRRERTSAR